MDRRGRVGMLLAFIRFRRLRDDQAQLEACIVATRQCAAECEQHANRPCV